MKLSNLTSYSAWKFFFLRKRQILIEFLDPLTVNIREHRPGSYYSPILTLSEYRRDRDGVEYWTESFKNRDEVKKRHFDICRFNKHHAIAYSRYNPSNDSFPPSDALTLAYIINEYKPSTIVEVGSGWSSGAILDTLTSVGIECNCVFIEPNPERLDIVLSDNDRAQHRVLINEVQDVPLSIFSNLSPNDVLFIDSSHVLKPCSDLAFLMLRAIPHLKSGVILHFHDISYPYSYPIEWISRGWAWNETLALRLILVYGNFKILAFNSWFGHEEPAQMSMFSESYGGSIWLQKL